MTTESDPEIVLKLPLSALHIIVQHLYLGLYVGNPVHDLVRAIVDQANPQIALATAESPPAMIATEDPPGTERLN